MQRSLCSTSASGAALLPGSAATGRLRCVRPVMQAAATSSGASSSTAHAANGTGAKGSGTQFLRPHLLKLAPYTPIEPFEVLSARYGRKPEDIVKLDANENPYGPPPEVRAALANMAFPHVYPDPETRALRAALAKMHDIPVEHLLVGWLWGGTTAAAVVVGNSAEHAAAVGWHGSTQPKREAGGTSANSRQGCMLRELHARVWTLILLTSQFDAWAFAPLCPMRTPSRTIAARQRSHLTCLPACILSPNCASLALFCAGGVRCR